MNKEEAKMFIKRHSGIPYIFSIGLISGMLLVLIVLGLSFVKPHIDIILNITPVFGMAVGGYSIYKMIQLNRVKDILEDE